MRWSEIARVKPDQVSASAGICIYLGLCIIERCEQPHVTPTPGIPNSMALSAALPIGLGRDMFNETQPYYTNSLARYNGPSHWSFYKLTYSSIGHACRVTVFAFTLMVGGVSLERSQAADLEWAPPENGKNFVVEAFDSEVRELNNAHIDELKSFGLAGDARTRGVAHQITIWSAGLSQISVCFVNGPKAYRAYIARIAKQWTRIPGTHVPLDFGNESDPRICTGKTSNAGLEHIRVRIKNSSVWSLIGNRAIIYNKFPLTRPTMSLNVDGVSRRALNRMILHEFGHALGLEHEHQHPKSFCDSEYKIKALRKFLQKENNWSKQEFKKNMVALHKRGYLIKDLEMTKFDTKSVMYYAFPSRFYLNGADSKCFARRDPSISKRDRELMRKIYPSDKSKRVAMQNVVREMANDKIKKRVGPDGKVRADLLNLIDEIVPRL